MAGGKIQGNQPPQKRESADDIIARARAKVRASVRPSKRSVVARSNEVSNFGPPSEEHDRPMNAPGERDISGVAPGRLNQAAIRRRE